MRFIRQEVVQEAFDYLHEHAAHAGAAAANRERSHYGLKQVRSRLFLDAPDGSIAQKEAWAEAHPDFAAAVEAHVSAVRDHENFRNQQSKAMAIIDAWRTQSSNLRGMGKVA